MLRLSSRLFLVALAQLAGLTLISCFPSTPFAIKDIYVGDAFLEGFNFATFNDPTHGRVNYVSKEEAIQKNLVEVSDDKFVMRADSENKVQPTARGRDSIRIQSYASYSDSVVVLDLSHMPEGCSTWPAFWSLSVKGPWPTGGEIDSESSLLIEGVNRNSRNLVSLHTTPQCTMPMTRIMDGENTSTNCDANVNFNQGCGVNVTRSFSYGSGFNKAGGGWYVMERTAKSGITVWFWSRNDYTVPREVKHPGPKVRPDASWGLPVAFFPFGPLCNADHFDAHQIVFDDTFCGDFAGALYPTSGCPSTCVDFVDNNPEAFSQAYWEVNSLRVYTLDDNDEAD